MARQGTHRPQSASDRSKSQKRKWTMQSRRRAEASAATTTATTYSHTLRRTMRTAAARAALTVVGETPTTKPTLGRGLLLTCQQVGPSMARVKMQILHLLPPCSLRPTRMQMQTQTPYRPMPNLNQPAHRRLLTLASPPTTSPSSRLAPLCVSRPVLRLALSSSSGKRERPFPRIPTKPALRRINPHPTPHD